MIDKYGDVVTFGTNAFKDIMLKKFGVEHSRQYHDIQRKAKSNYMYDDMYFNSSWELAVYIYGKQHLKSFKVSKEK